MNPDEYDFRRHMPKEPANEALDLIKGLENRNLILKNAKVKESLEIYSEDELVRKKCYDEMRCEMPGQPRSTFLMVFSPDGSKIASTHGNHNIYVTDLKSGKNIKTLIGHPRTPWCIAFHPTSNQIVASGCLGGEVRIWDLNGGSEVWTAGNQSVIASIAFHPNDRVLVIATYNELYFWDWSMPEPFVQVATANPKEKIRYVAFDKLGHKLITGITNTPQTRWERVRAPVPVPRQAERLDGPYRLRITPRLVNATSPQERTYVNMGTRTEPQVVSVESAREVLSNVPERERRITASYRNLLREYEQLVQRYLKVYKPPTMIDRGTDPMEPNMASTSSSTQAPESEPSTSGSSNTNQPSTETDNTSHQNFEPEPQPSTSQNCSSLLVMPSRILAMKKQPTEAHSTQTSDSRKHKSSGDCQESTQEKRSKCDDSGTPSTSSGGSHAETATQTQSPRRLLVINDRNQQPEPSTSGFQDKPVRNSGVRILCPKTLKRKLFSNNDPEPSTSSDPQPSTSRGLSSTDDILSNIRPLAEEVRNRFLPIIKSLPACDRPRLIRRFENSRAHERLKFRQMCPTFSKKPNRRPVLETSSDSSSSDDERTASRTRLPNQNSNSNEGDTECVHTTNSNNATTSSANSLASASSNITNITGVRNFIMELEQLLMTILLTEIEGNEGQASTNNDNNNPPSNSSSPVASSSNQEELTSSNIRSSPVSISANREQDLIRPSAVTIENSIFRRFIQRHESQDFSESRTATSNSDEPSHSSPSGVQSRTSSPIYSRNYPRRRLPAHRISAFMPTRVNYNRSFMRYRRASPLRLGTRLSNTNTFPIDELINYSERPNAEDNVPQDNQPPPETNSPDNPPEQPRSVVNLENMYSNIVQGLESSLNDVRNLRTNNRANETSDMLSSFSESLENIMNQSDTILRNLGGSITMLPNYSDQNENRRRESNQPRVSFNDQSFYIRSNAPPEASTSNEVSNLTDLQDGRSVVESDHNYPRNPENNQNQGSGDNMSPLMTSLHMTISYIQRQARLLRHQVESIERIDRTMIEVEQLQLVRQLITEFLRYLRSLAGESRSAGMSSVRQMMAGTRISDSSPYDSQSEEQSQQNPQPSTTAGASTSSEPSQPRPRSSSRKTYPPSRLFRLQRHQRRSLFFFPRRYTGHRPDRTVKHSGPCRTAPSRTSSDATNPLRHLSSYSLINSSSLNLMARRLEHLLTEQTRLITRPQENNSQSNRSTPATELGERILSIRLQDCINRVNRVMGNSIEGSRIRNGRSDPIVVTQDGASRFGARHFLSLIVDGMSKHIEELGGSNVSQSLRGQIHSVLAMALLLSDLLLLQLVDSIPPPAGMNLDVERESLTSRIDQMCGQMLQNRFSSHSHQLTRSLHHMRLTMRRAYRALGQTYNARRNAMLPNRPDTNRRQLLNRYLRNINMRRHSQNLGTDPTTSSSDTNPTPEISNDNMTRGWSSLRDLIMRYSDNTGEDEDVTSSNSNQDTQERTQRFENASSNNSDDNDDESEWYVNNSSRSSNLYRTNNVNLVHNNNEESSSNQRSWNVPSVQVNDVPVPISEQPSLFHQRIMTHRQRLAERVSELRSFPQMGGLRPRFLHPLYASVNPFDADLDDPQREATYDCDFITTVTPNHRIQVWDISSGNIPAISNPMKNIIVSECKIHNDASVDIAKDGTILVTLLPSGGYLNATNRLGVYSLKWDTLGQCLYTTSFEQNAVSVSLSPLSRHLVVGLASRRVSIVPSDRWTMARIFIIDPKNVPGDRLPVLRELGQNRDSRATNYKSVNCIRWLPTSGQGLIYATNTGQLVILT